MSEKVFNQAMLDKKIAQFEKQLINKQKEVDYYKKIAQEAGQKRLLEVYQMSQLIDDRKKAETKLEKVIEDLQAALDEVKTLRGFIPICSSCKKIRDDKGCWNQIEEYFQEHSTAQFSHGLCPECMDKLYGDQDWYKAKKNAAKLKDK